MITLQPATRTHYIKVLLKRDRTAVPALVTIIAVIFALMAFASMRGEHPEPGAIIGALILVFTVLGLRMMSRAKYRRYDAFSDEELSTEYQMYQTHRNNMLVAQERNKMGCAGKLVIAAIVIGIILAAADFVLGILVGKRMAERIAAEGTDIMLLAHPTATFRGCEYIDHHTVDFTERFDFDLSYQDNLATGDLYYLRFSVFIDSGFFTNGQIHHAEFGRDTGYAKPAAAIEAIVKMLTK